MGVEEKKHMFDRDEDDDDIVISFKENNEANQSKKSNLKNGRMSMVNGKFKKNAILDTSQNNSSITHEGELSKESSIDAPDDEEAVNNSMMRHNVGMGVADNVVGQQKN